MAQRQITTKFFHYPQNNSGGHFHFEKSGITHHVLIEAINAKHADFRAEEVGIYFDGCESDIDCSCCGDRWDRAYGDGDEEPMIYGQKASEYKDINWMKENPEIVVHYLDGKIEWYEGKE